MDLIVGDVHGDISVVQNALNFGAERVIFLGDFVDSYDFSKKEQLAALKLAADSKAIMLWGNHDLSYICPEMHAASGYTKSKRSIFIPIYANLLLDDKKFLPYFVIKRSQAPDVLLTHAGLHPSYVTGPDEVSTLEEVTKEEWKSFIFKRRHYLLALGEASGGLKGQPGGITWMRPSDLKSGDKSGILQIFGHTPQDDILDMPEHNMMCIDTMTYGNRSALLIDNTYIQTIWL